MPTLNRRKFFHLTAQGAAALSFGWPIRRAKAAATPYILHIHCSGGWDQTMVFDPKLGQESCAQEAGASLAKAGNLAFVAHANRPAVNTFFTEQAAKAVIVNGLYCGSIDHAEAVRETFSTVPDNQSRPLGWLTHYAHALNPAATMPHLIIDAPAFPGSYEEAVVHLKSGDLNDYLTAPANGPLGKDDEAALHAFKQAVFGKLPAKVHPDTLDGDKFRALAANALREAQMRDDLQKAAAALGAIGNDTGLERLGKLAIELFAEGSCQAITLQAGAEGSWDTTADNFFRQSANYENLFAALNAILECAKTNGLQRRLLLLVTSERGRSPKLNSQSGKGAWPYSSILLWGDLVKGGSVVGESDAYLRGVAIDPLFGEKDNPNALVPQMCHIFAAIYLQTGVATKAILKGISPLARILEDAPA